MFQFQVLGAVDLRDSQGRELRSVLAQPKRIALLAHLAVASTRGYERRDTLLGLFWPELDEEHARGALNSSLYYLRRSLSQDIVETRGEELRLNAAVIRTDVSAFEQAAAAGDHATVLDIYRGELLQGWFVDDSPEFDQWLSVERARLRNRAVASARALADAAPKGSAEAITFSRRAAALAPDDETVTRGLIAALADAGDRAGALHVFQQFAERLERDFGTAASPETLRLVAAVSARPVTAEPTEPVALGTREPGPVRRRSRRPIALALASALIVTAVVTAFALRRADALPQRVLVAPFENRTGIDSLGAIGEMSADWLAQGVAQTGVADIADRAAVAAITEKTQSLVEGNRAEWLAAARRLQARLLLTGAYYLNNGRLEIRATLYDVANGEIATAFEPVTATVDSALSALNVLQRQVPSAIAFALDARGAMRSNSQTRSPPSYDAYLEMLAGDRNLARREYPEAHTHFMRAFSLDSTFVQAALPAASLSLRLGRGAEADSLLAIVGRHLDLLSPVQRLFYDMLEAEQKGEHAQQMRLVEELARRVPESRWPYTFAVEAQRRGRVREAARVLASVDPYSPALEGMFAYWVVRCMSLHAVGQYREELRVAETGLKQYPHNVAIISSKVRALAALGRTDELKRELAAMSPSEWGPGTWNPGTAFGIASAELEAHGHSETATFIRESLVAWYVALPAERKADEPPYFGLAFNLYLAQAWPQLRERVELLVAKDSANLRWQMMRALVAAQRRDAATARQIEARLVAISPEQLRKDALLPSEISILRARIAAFLGESEAALDHLRKAAAQGSEFNLYMHTDPAFKSLRSLPAFREHIKPKG
jgi:serine/threonine-protein kinase